MMLQIKYCHKFNPFFCGLIIALFCVTNIQLSKCFSGGDKSFVIIVPSFNCKQWYRRNLDSIFEQKYRNYRVIYIDDASTDGTADLVEKYVVKHGVSNKVTLIKNVKNVGVMANTYKAIHMCKPYEVVVIVDGDDWFSDSGVLTYLNEVYQDPNIWMTYGSFVEFPSGEEAEWVHRIPERIIDQGVFRQYEWVATHLRTFYAALFQRIKIDDFKVNGKFVSVAADLAAMFPMLEMAAEHSLFIPRVMYVYNAANSINNFKIRHSLQLENDLHIRSKKKYYPLEDLFFINDSGQVDQKADLIVFSYDRPLQLYAFLESVSKNIVGLNQVFVIYRASLSTYDEAYKKCFSAFPDLPIVIKKQTVQEGLNDFRKLTLDVLDNNATEYVLFAVDDIIVTGAIDISDSIRHLQRSHAYGFYMRLGENITECYMTRTAYLGIPKCKLVHDQVLKWRISDGFGDWNYPNTLDMTLYPKNKILPTIKKLEFSSPNKFEAAWDRAGKTDGSYNAQGLCYLQSKIINIPFNLVQNDYSANRHMTYSKEDFLKLFNDNKRIDVEKYFHVVTKAPHANLDLMLKNI